MQDFDPSSAFFANIVNKKKKNLNISEQSQVSNKDRSKDRATLQSHSAKSEDEVSNMYGLTPGSNQKKDGISIPTLEY